MELGAVEDRRGAELRRGHQEAAWAESRCGWGGRQACGLVGAGLWPRSPGSHPVRCSDCGLGSARRGVQGHGHCGSWSNPPSGPIGPGPSQSQRTGSGLGGKRDSGRWQGLLLGPRPPWRCRHRRLRGPISADRSTSLPETKLRYSPSRVGMRTPAHCTWLCPHLSRPHSCPPSRTADGAPRRPGSGSGDAPGGSLPGGLGWGRVNPSPWPRGLWGRGSGVEAPDLSRDGAGGGLR